MKHFTSVHSYFLIKEANAMNVMSRTKLAKEKVKAIQAGYNAYAETEEISRLIKKELKSLGIDVIEDKSSLGCWFIPNKKT